MSEQGRALALTQDGHNYTQRLLGAVHEVVSGRSRTPVKLQENTALLSSCGPAGRSQHVSLLGPGKTLLNQLPPAVSPHVQRKYEEFCEE